MKFLLAFVLLPFVAQAQEGSIDPAWIYVTPIHWKRAPRGFHERSAPATIAILYPEGQYLELSTYLIQRDGRDVAFSVGDGNLVRFGTWARTDDAVIRIHSRDVWWDPETVKHQPDEPHPMPFETETCALEGNSKSHLAGTIHCKRISVSPARLALPIKDLQDYAHIAFVAGSPPQPQSTNPAKPK